MAPGDNLPRASRPLLGRGAKTINNLDIVDESLGKAQETSTQTSEGGGDATVKFIKKVLCKQTADSGRLTGMPDIDSQRLDDLLPPLTSSNETDVELYAILAVILHEFVQSWYSRITPDQDFVVEIVRIVAHCLRGLEQRLRNVDLEMLVFDELPALLMAHVDAVRAASETRPEFSQANKPPTVYHSIHPHPALSPLPQDTATTAEQLDNEVAWSQLLVSRILPLVLPPEDLRNPCLHVLVSEVLSEMIVHGAICNKASQPWLLWEGVTKAIVAMRPNSVAPRYEAETTTPQRSGRLEQFGLLATSSSSSSSVSLSVPLQPPGSNIVLANKLGGGRLSTLSWAFWTMAQCIVTIWLGLRWLVIALAQASSKPSETTDLERRPVIRFRLWPCLSRLASLDQRMPWTVGMIGLLQHLALNGPGKLGGSGSALDRLLHSQLNERFLDSSSSSSTESNNDKSSNSSSTLLAPALRTIRSALFPNNALGPPRPVPTSEAEVDAIRRACAVAILDAIPPYLRPAVFGAGSCFDRESMYRDIESSVLLDFADPYVNKHLIVSAVELVAVRIFPELADAALDNL